MEFNNAPPEWENKGAEPGEDLKKQGFLAGYKPPAAYFNWFWNKTSACIKELQEKLKGITKSDVGLDKVDNKSLEEILTEVTMDKANAKDTSGLVGAAQENVKAQQLLDELANRVATKVVEKGMIANNLTTTNPEMVLAAPMGKELKRQLDEQNNNKLDKTEFDNLTIGGRNLYTGTKDFSGTWTNASSWTTDGEYKGFTVKTRTDSWCVLCQERNVYAGEVYTCSLYIKIGTLNNFQMGPGLGNSGLKFTTISKNNSVSEVNTWTRIYQTIKVTEDGTMRFGVEPNATGGRVWVCGMKLEKGTKPTDWTPAPEDLININKITNRLDVTEDGFVLSGKAGKSLQDQINSIQNPTFDDSGTTEGINSFTDFMNSVKSKMSIFDFFKNFKAGMKYVLHTGKLVNNATTTQEGFALDARMGKTLQDQITEQNKNIGYTVFANVEESHTNGDLIEIVKNYFNTGKHNITFMVSNNVSNIPYENSWYTIQTIFSHWTNSIRIIAYALWSNSVYICNFNKSSGNMDFDWQKLVTNSDLPIFQSFIVDPQGSDRIVLTLTNNADSGKVFATNGDVTAFNGYIKGVQIEHNTNKLTVFLSENRAGNIRINVMYMKL